jgi:hypothetical protein
VWNVIGKIFSEENSKLTEDRYSLTAICAVLLSLEFHFIKRHSGIIDSDCLFMLLPLSASVFAHIINTKVTCKHSVYLRNTSTMVYLLHGSIRPFFTHFTREICGIWYGIITFILVLFSSYIFCFVVFKLQKKYKWLKYLY